MKSVQKLILMIVGTVFLFACNSNQPESNINLDNGQKWTVNSEMTPHIEKASDLLKAFISEQDNDYLTLAENIKNQNNALIKSCTMKGKSHDELHKWLHPHIELINDLSNAENFNDAQIIVSKLEKSFETYKTHFQ